MNEDKLSQNSILEGPFWPEPVKVITLKQVGNRLQIQAVGIQSQKYYSQLLTEQDTQKISSRQTSLIDFQGDATQFFLGIEAKRIRYSYQFDPFYAVNVSQIDSLPHQIEAVYHYILKNPRIRFLLADDPGAGKTIVAGLLLKELKYRGIIERTLIIVPGHLKDQWVRELKEKFNEDFTFIDRGFVNARWATNVWQKENQVITSMDFSKQDQILVGLAESEWDLIIVDEAHKMAAYKYGEKTQKTARYRLGELISRKTKFLIFLTATPHKGDPENFRLFIDLLEPNLFASTDILTEAVEKGENPLFLRRLKEDIKNFDGTPIFPPREVVTIKYRLSDDEKRLYNAVTDYIQNHYQVALRKEKRSVAFALMILQRRLASSIRAIRRSLERRRDRLTELYKKGQIIQEEGMIDEELLEDLAEEEKWEQEELLEKLTSAESLEELKEEIEKLEGLVNLAKEVEKKETEVKLDRLKQVMDSEGIKKKGEKLLIFTESRDTLEYLGDKIKGGGYTVTFIHGGMNLNQRIHAEHEFNDVVQIMVATEAAGEGINLQKACWLMVNYDIPWNPNRLEQRMGRIHRYGQQNEVHVYNLVASDTHEGKILSKLFDKLEKIKEQLGSDRIFDVIGEVLPGRSLKDLIEDAIANRRTMEDILKDFDRIPDEDLIQRVREATLESLATRHIDLSKILEESRLAKENRLVPEYIEKFFLKASEQLKIKAEKRKDDFYRIDSLPYPLRNVSFDFKTKFGEVFTEYKKFSFVKDQAQKGQAEFVAPGHPLLETVIENILKDNLIHLTQGSVFIDPSANLEGLIWFLEIELKDGKGEIAGKRIYALYQDKNNFLKQVPASILWDLKPTRVTMPEHILNLQTKKEEVINFAIENTLSGYIEELRQIRERDASIKEKYGLRSLNQLISESDAKLADYETRQIKGENIPEAIIVYERRRKEELIARRERLTKDIEQETNLLPSVPNISGVVAVLPEHLLGEGMETDKEIEAMGMKVAMEYEINVGRNPQDVSGENLGFDIKSKENEQIFRYIEVKARAGTGKIALTPNEWLMAKRLAEEYWLYVVENVKMNPQLYIIHNPAKVLEPSEEIEIVRYIVKDWKSKAERVS